MANISAKHTRFMLPIELQFLAIPTHWMVREEKMSGERCFVPAVNQNVDRRPTAISDPEEIRKQFFRMKCDEESALELLKDVGVWSAVEDEHVVDGKDGSLLSGTLPVGIREMRLLGACGHRWFSGRALIETVDGLCQEQQHWRELRRNRRRLHAAFAPGPSSDSPPYQKSRFAIESRFGNTLQVHLEWRGRHPYAVIQTITGRELLTALAWIDLVTDAECKICHNPKCGIEYTRGGRKFCSWQCEHANTMRIYRLNLKKKASSHRHGRRPLEKPPHIKGESAPQNGKRRIKTRKPPP